MTHWTQQAECRGAPTEIFFATENQLIREAEEEQRYVINVYCFRCPVQAECLAFAKRMGCKEGVWGGLTETERGTRPRYKRST